MKYFSFNWDEEIVHHFIKKKEELCQILHLAALYDVPNWTLVIGDRNGEVIAGIRIKFSQAIRNAWSNCVRVCSNMTFEPFIKEDWHTIESVIDDIQVNGAPLDLRSLKHDWWLYINTVTRYCFPLPPIARIVPKVGAHWNGYKSGSDTRSKIAAEADYHPPTRTLQGNVVALSVLDVLITVYQLLQFTSTTKPLHQYTSILHWRTNASKRVPFKKALFNVHLFFHSYCQRL